MPEESHRIAHGDGDLQPDATTAIPGPANAPSMGDRRAGAAIAGHSGDGATARAALRDHEPAVRKSALHALVRLKIMTEEEVVAVLHDPDPSVRAAACELGSELPQADFLPLLDDEDDIVVEAAAYALGEVQDRRATERLIAVARDHEDPLCRESAVAALGAIGDESAKPAVLGALEDLPAIRRRAVIALSVFDGQDVQLALRARLEDRDWQVRQAAEDILALNDVGPD